jgi:hypothetical protein
MRPPSHTIEVDHDGALPHSSQAGNVNRRTTGPGFPGHKCETLFTEIRKAKRYGNMLT